jgi:hypothetical protein
VCSPGTGTNSIPVGSGTPEAGRIACADGTTSVAGSTASSDCSDLLEGWYYTGQGPISNDNVLQCPEDHFCDGLSVITVPAGASVNVQGLTACPTGSGTVGVWAAADRDSINDCRRVYPGYYFDGDASCTTNIAATAAVCGFKLCDDTTTPNTSFCTGAVIPAGTLTADVGLTSCATRWTAQVPSQPTRSYCNVATAGVDCVEAAQCMSPP